MFNQIKDGDGIQSELGKGRENALRLVAYALIFLLGVDALIRFGQLHPLLAAGIMILFFVVVSVFVKRGS